LENNGQIVSQIHRPGGEFLTPLLAQRLFIFLFCASAILTALALTFIFSEKYESATTIIYRPIEEIETRNENLESFGGQAPAPSFKIANNYLQELVISEEILKTTVLELGLHIPEEVSYEGPWYERLYRITKDTAKKYLKDGWMLLKYGRLIEEDPTRAAIQGLRKNVRLVDTSSYFYYLVVRDKRPLRAAKIVDTIAKHMVTNLQEAQRSEGSTRKVQLRTLLKAKENELFAYRKEIENLLNESEIADAPLETQHISERISNLESVLSQLEADILDRRSRLSSISAYRQLRPGILNDADPDVAPTDFIQPEDYKRLTSERVTVEIELEGMQAKQASLEQELEELKSSIQLLPTLQIKLDHLNDLLASAKRDYIQIADAYYEADVQSAESLSEIKVIHSAVIPRIPVAPIKIYHVGLAAFLSLVVSVGLVYLMTFSNVQFLFPPGRRQPSRPASSSGDRRASGNRRKFTDIWTARERRSGNERRLSSIGKQR